jgi:hypothetical protein
MLSVKILLAVGDDDDRQDLVAALGDVMMVTGPQGPGSALAMRTIQFGRIQAAPDLALHLYVIPAQRIAEYLCAILAQDISGYALVANTGRAEAMSGVCQVAAILRAKSSAPHIVGVCGDERAPASVLAWIGVAPDVPVVPVAPGNRESVKRLLCALLQQIADWVATQGEPTESVAGGEG